MSTPSSESGEPRVTLPVELRDYFAGQALMMVRQPEYPTAPPLEQQASDLARIAYMVADAMLKAREAR